MVDSNCAAISSGKTNNSETSIKHIVLFVSVLQLLVAVRLQLNYGKKTTTTKKNLKWLIFPRPIKKLSLLLFCDPVAWTLR